MAQEAYIHVTRLKLDYPIHDTININLNRRAASQLNDLLARALNCLPEAEWKDWYTLSDKLGAFVQELPLAPQHQPQEQGEVF